MLYLKSKFVTQLYSNGENHSQNSHSCEIRFFFSSCLLLHVQVLKKLDYTKAYVLKSMVSTTFNIYFNNLQMFYETIWITFDSLT